MRSRTPRPRGRHVDTEAERHTGLSLVMLVAPFVTLVVVLMWLMPEDGPSTHPSMWAVGALFLSITWGAEWLIVHVVRQRRAEELRKREQASVSP